MVEMFSDQLNGCSGTECECCSVNGCDYIFKGITDLTVQGMCCAKPAASCSTLGPKFYPSRKYMIVKWTFQAFNISSALA